MCPPVGASTFFNRRCNTRSRAWRLRRAFVCRVADYSPARYEYETRLLGFGSVGGFAAGSGISRVSCRAFFDIVFTRRDAWAAVVLSGLVSDNYGPLPRASYMYHSVSAIMSWMCEPCKFWVTGSCLSCLGHLAWISEQQLESLILAQNERWRHA